MFMCVAGHTFMLEPTVKQNFVLPYSVVYCTVVQYTYICLAWCSIVVCGPGSSVGIATELRAGRSGIESR